MRLSDESLTVEARAESLFRQRRREIHERTDRLFAGLLLIEWLGAMVAAHIVAPVTWSGSTSQVHVHVQAALFLGGTIALFPALLGILRPGRTSTRHTIAIAQMIMSALLIDVTGGRIETHFHIFGSLAFLAFYRDWKIFGPATVVVAADHLLRGIYWPESVYGVSAAPWRWLEHAWWVLFEDIFLVNSCMHSVREMRGIASQQAQLERAKELTERTVRTRTAELRTSESVFRSLSAASPLGIFQSDPHAVVTYCNARWTEIVGRTSADVLGDGWMAAVYPDDLTVVADQRTTMVDDRAETEAEFRIIRPDGHVRWVQLRSKPMVAEDGTAVGHVGTLQDITDRKQAEGAREEEARTSAALAQVGRELISSLETPVLLERVCQLTAKVLGADYSNTWLLHADDVYRPIAGYGLSVDEWEVLQTIGFVRTELIEAITQLESGRIVELDAKLIRHPLLSAVLARHGAKVAACIPLLRGEQLIGVQVVGYRASAAVFTTERARIAQGIAQLASMALANAKLVEEIADASRLKSEFLSTMSHELRTPLNVILGYTDMLADDPDRDERALLLGRVRRTGLDLLNMITATLDLSRIAAGKDDAQFEHVALQELWAAVAAEFAAMHRSEAVTLRWIEPGDIVLRTDRRKLSAIVKNLVGNAVKFTPKGNVAIVAEVVGEDCIVTVRDTGIGIPPDSLPFIFDMFRQVDNSDSRSYDGAGLGLYIVKTLVTQLGGTIHVQSELGRGSVFRVVLPATGADLAALDERLPAVG